MNYQYMVDQPEFPYCAGCGHTWINKALDSALQKINIKPSKINLITDIGCVGLVDKLFLTNTIHTTHGRSTAIASGIQLADQILYDNDALHIIMIGDGGATIGLLHLIESAKLNINLTVILHNNFVYGMTGGQNSGLTPENFRTATTMSGNLTPGLHILNIMEASHAGYLSRKLATDKDLDLAIKEAIEYPGFSLIEVVELCTGYATKWNKMTKSDVQEILENMDAGKLGVISKIERENYGNLYKQAFPKSCPQASFKPISVNKFTKLNSPISLVLAGSAGEGVQFATKILSESSVRNGLNILQTNDNPVTIGTGFSISELIISSDEIFYTGIDPINYLLISSIDGLKRSSDLISSLNTSAKIIIDESLVSELRNPNKAEIHSYPFRKLAPDVMNINMVLMGYLLKIESQIDFSDFVQALEKNMKSPEKAIFALETGYKL
jgi:2-oxoglutarate/2-oxoacid ferredoxin oxidoreductase subunit beta